MTTHDGDFHTLSSDNFDWIFDPEEHNIFVAGIDINNSIAPAISELQEAGFPVFVINGITLPYSKEANDAIRNSGVKYIRFKED